MNASAYIQGYLHKTATMMSEAGTVVEQITPPTPDPAPVTDKNVKAVERMEKTDMVDEMTKKKMLDENGL